MNHHNDDPQRQQFTPEQIAHQNQGRLLREAVRGVRGGLTVASLEEIVGEPTKITHVFTEVPADRHEALEQYAGRLREFTTELNQYLADLEEGMVLGAVDFEPTNADNLMHPHQRLGCDLLGINVHVDHLNQTIDGKTEMFDDLTYQPPGTDQDQLYIQHAFVKEPTFQRRNFRVFIGARPVVMAQEFDDEDGPRNDVIADKRLDTYTPITEQPLWEPPKAGEQDLLDKALGTLRQAATQLQTL